MSQNFPKPYEPFHWDINVKVDSSNYATKTHQKHFPYWYFKFRVKIKLASLKNEVDKLNTEKLRS